MGLLDQYAKFRDYIAANTPRSTRPVAKPGDVLREGLLSPNKFNAPAANRFKDSVFGLLGGIPGAGAPVGFTQGADYFNRGEPVAGAVSVASGVLPFIPPTAAGLFTLAKVADRIGAPLPTGPARKQAGMFIGPKAKTWNADAARQAEEMLAKGIDPREVWKQTGTMKGVDGALRQEIPDNNSIPMNPSWGAMEDIKQGNITTDIRQRVFAHPKLSAAYPDTKHISITLDPRGGDSGSYGQDLIEMIRVGASKENGKPNRSTMLHELQHAIQQREGWARGGSPEYMASTPSYWPPFAPNNDVLTAAEKLTELQKVYGITPTEAAAKWRPAFKIDDDLMNQAIDIVDSGQLPKWQLELEKYRVGPHEAYRRLAGEAEARLTQARMNMTMPERLQSYPYDMLDVPQDQLIVRGLLDGPAMSYADEAARKPKKAK